MDKLLKKSASLELRKGGAKEAKRKYPLTAGDYELLEEIGHGVSATVYRALCLPFKEVVAIKSLDLDRCNSDLDDIRREAQTMQLICHPNLVSAHCSFVVDQSLKIVMPCLAGGSCLNVMKVGHPDGLEEPIIATVLKETLKALDYLHKQGHIHRDVKAGNILLDEHGGVKLGDFGVSACMFDTGDRQRLRNTFVGTPCWMAPEVLEQIHGYDFKADIWSFGITALELAHGHAPFSKYPPLKILMMTLQSPPPTLDHERDRRFSKSFKEMIAMCLVKNPARRPTAEKLLKHSFFKSARSTDYIAKHLLEGLPPLGQRVKNLKLKDAERLAQMKMPYEEKEEKSQNEYKRGLSCWKFDVEDLIAETALPPEDDYSPMSNKLDKHELCGALDRFCTVVAADKADAHPKNGVLEGQAQPTDTLPDEHRDCSKQPRIASPSASKTKGQLITSMARARISDQSQEDGKSQVDKDEIESQKLENESEEQTDWDRQNKWGRRLHSKNVATPDLSGLSVRDIDKDLDLAGGHLVISGVCTHLVSEVDACRRDKFCRDRKSAAPSGALSDREQSRIRAITNVPLIRRSSSEATMTKVKEPLSQKKNRFSVTSESDVEMPKPLAQLSAFPSLTSTAMEISHPGNVAQINAVHHDNDPTLSISATDGSGEQRSTHRVNRSKNFSRTLSEGSTDYSLDFQRYRVQYVIELQNRISDLEDEVMQVKLKNMQLEHQLAVMRKDLEGWTRKEKSAYEN